MKLPSLPKNVGTYLSAAQKCVNFYFENGIDGPQLVSTPGLTGNYGADTSGTIQKVYTATTGQVFGIIGDTLYEYSGTSKTSRGALSVTASNFSIADNGTTMLIVANGVGANRCALSAGAPTTITDANFPSAPIGAAFLDGYLITGVIAGTFYLSQLYDANDWTPVQFATAESSPDKLTDIQVVGRTMYVIGYQTIEAWYNTGNPDFPLESISGQTLQYGSTLREMIATGNGGVFFVGGERGFGHGVYLYGANGLEKISTPFIEYEIELRGRLSWRASHYKLNSESIYEIAIGGASSKCYAYYSLSKTWVEKSWVSFPVLRYANLTEFDGTSTVLCFDRLIDRASKLSQSLHTDFTSDVTRYYDFNVVGDNSRKYFHKSFVLDVDVDFDGAGDLVLDPTLSWTDDGGLNFSSGIQLSKTATSASPQTMRFKWTRLGSSRQRIYRITFVGPAAKLVIKNAEVDLVIGGPG